MDDLMYYMKSSKYRRMVTWEVMENLFINSIFSQSLIKNSFQGELKISVAK
jgi:hypothetical protein